MLSNGLVESLLNRNILCHSTRILAEFEKTDNSLRKLKLTDLFNIEKVEKLKNNDYLFTLCRIDTKERVLVTIDKILTVDGMSPKVLARAYGLSTTGEKNKSGKRRGRPRKHFPYGIDAD